MLRSEFTERTKYEPDYDEYEIIEDAYYEFDGNKDEFCKWWLKARKDGYWKREYEIRKREKESYNELKKASEEYRAEKEETVEWLCNRIDKLTEEKNNLKEDLKKANVDLGYLKDEKKRVQNKLQEFDKIMDALSVLKNSL